MLDLGDVVAGVGGRVAVDRIVVEHAEDVRHVPIFAGARRGCGLFRPSAALDFQHAIETIFQHVKCSAAAVQSRIELAEALDRVGRGQALDLDLPFAQLFDRGRIGPQLSVRAGADDQQLRQFVEDVLEVIRARANARPGATTRRRRGLGRTITSFVGSSPSTSTRPKR